MFQHLSDIQVELAQCCTVWLCSSILILAFSYTIYQISKVKKFSLLIAINILFLISNVGSILKEVLYWEFRQMQRSAIEYSDPTIEAMITLEALSAWTEDTCFCVAEWLFASKYWALSLEIPYMARGLDIP